MEPRFNEIWAVLLSEHSHPLGLTGHYLESHIHDAEWERLKKIARERKRNEK